ncbi:hypothetical protein [Salibacterium qingdaonense]|uniref:Uncharacterized protein n=1 Tax=Salibacterium qingdaonense TaxID=266892 RepID=A0A1I4QXA9_9BACI|nr:hypothetical protein [Salibacterium qingdaonense]SFM44679.1 hypothetical protein SAMN04488054_1527 [Salibacterium qingdaonense]
MNEIDLLIKTLERKDMASIVKYFHIRVDGFQKSFHNAPSTKLKTAIYNELTNFSKKKKKPKVKLNDIHKYLSECAISNNPNLKNVNFEELGIIAEMGWKNESATILAILYTKFDDIYFENLNKIKDNIENKQFILNGIVDPLSLDDKLKILSEKLISKKDTYNRLKEYVESVKKEKGEELFGTLSENVNKNGIQSFIQILSNTDESNKVDVILAFLIEKERYRETDFQPFLHFVLSWFDKKTLDAELERNKILAEERDDLATSLNDAKYFNNELSQLQNNYDNLLKKHQSLIENYNDILKEKGMLENQISALHPFNDYFKELSTSKNILIMTNETSIFKNTPLSECTIGIDDLSKNIRKKNTAPYKSKTIFITRMSFPTSREWNKTRKFFEQNNLPFYELAGYGLEDYIPQIIESLFKGEYEFYGIDYSRPLK